MTMGEKERTETDCHTNLYWKHGKSHKTRNDTGILYNRATIPIGQNTRNGRCTFTCNVYCVFSLRVYMLCVSLLISLFKRAIFRLFVLKMCDICCLDRDKLYIFGILMLLIGFSRWKNPRKIWAKHHIASPEIYSDLNPLVVAQILW